VGSPNSYFKGLSALIVRRRLIKMQPGLRA
jgi:hypothetical protein